MTTAEKVARRKLSLLDLAGELANVSKACKVMGYSRQQFYEIRRNYQTYGAVGLLDRLPGAKGPHPNRVDEAVETAILEHCLNHLGHGPLRVSQELSLKGDSGQFWRRAGCLESAQPVDEAGTYAPARKECQRTIFRTFRRTDSALGAFQPGVPRAAYRDETYRRSGGRGHLLCRHSQGRRQDLPAVGDRLLFPLCLGQALH